MHLRGEEMISSDYDTIASYWQHFIHHDEVPDQAVRDNIFQSWIRSKAALVNPFSLVLPIPNELPNEILTNETFLILSKGNFPSPEKYLNSFHRELYYFIKQLTDRGVVVLNLLKNGNDLVVVLNTGNPEFIDGFNAKNITVGSKFNENIVGTNAAALALLSRSVEYVIGAEHFSQALHEYASIAAPTMKTDGTIEEVILAIMPKDLFKRNQLEIIKRIAIGREIMDELRHNKKELLLTEQLLNSDERKDYEGVVLTNYNGSIIKVNKWILDLLNLDEENILRNKIHHIFPQLAEYISPVTDTISQDICLNNCRIGGKNLFVQSKPVYIQGEFIGSVIYFQDKPDQKKDTVANYRANYVFADLIGTSPVFIETKKIAKKAAASDSNVLILGESGTGKEVFAQAIHNASNRKKNPFVPINCASLPKELIGSELFGYVEGAFTGASKRGSPGKFELANNGTIFLDEIGEMPLEIQSVLLRVLEDRLITRLGGINQIPVDFRLIVATNRNLWKSVAAKKFRLDLYYRLNILTVEIDPLRKRVEDIPLLTEYFFKKYSTSIGRNVMRIAPEVLSLFQRYNWPGNIRELKNVIERVVNLSSSSEITLADLPKEMTKQVIKQNSGTKSESPLSQQIIDVNYNFEDYEKLLIIDLLKTYRGNKARVAKEMGITRPTLYRKLKGFNLD